MLLHMFESIGYLRLDFTGFARSSNLSHGPEISRTADVKLLHSLRGIQREEVLDIEHASVNLAEP